MFNIAKSIYVGMDIANATKELPEAEIVPFGDAKNVKKRIDRLVNKYPNAVEIDNIPLPGFTLYDVSKKRWSSSEMDWLVIDPRGFLVKITSTNLASILKVTGITEGLIQDKCVWARDNDKTEMILVPTSSSLYQEAVKGTELIDAKVSMSNVNIGDTVLLQNNLQGRYLGCLSLYCSIQHSHKNGAKVQKMLRKQIIEVTPGKFHYQTDAKILKVITPAATAMTRDDSVTYINNLISKGNTFFTSSSKMNSGYYGNYGLVKYVSKYAEPKVEISLLPITRAEASIYLMTGKNSQDNGNMIVEDDKNRKYTICYPWTSTVRTFSSDEFTVQEIESISPESIHYSSTEQTNYFYFLNSNAPKKKLDSFKKFYKIVKHVKNDTYV